MKVLYFDCFAGISGDMTIGALLDLGVDKDYLKNELEKLNLKEYELEIKTVEKKGIRATDFDVKLKHSHHHHDNHAHSHEHRNLKNINKIIDDSGLSDKVKNLSKGIFLEVAKAEAKVHGKSLEEVHFHEVGAIDSIVDIVGCAICIDYLKPEKIISSPLHVGSGFVKCQHGLIPVPAPATLEIIAHCQIPTYHTGIKKEMVTPTGAAIIGYLTNEFGLDCEINTIKVGYGAGKRDLDIPNLLRANICEIKKKNKNIFVIETNIDDMSGEIAGFTMEKLLEANALDVFYTPIYMKKNRPAIKLSVICKEADIKNIEDIIFTQTTTIGVRKYKVDRECLERDIITKDTVYGKINFKVSRYKGIEKCIPEYEDCKKIAQENNISLYEVYKNLKSI